MRILYLSSHFPPDLGALASRVSDLSRSWAAAGHEVHVVTGLPAHPTGVIPPEYQGRAYVREDVGGVTVHRSWIFATPNAGRLRRSASYASFAASSVLGGLLGPPAPDVIIASTPQFLAAISGLVLGRLRDVPLVLEVRDLWPKSIWEVGALSREHPGVRALETLETQAYRRAARVVVVSPGFLDHVAERVPSLSPRDIPVIPNGVRLERFEPGSSRRSEIRAELGIPAGPLVSYVGTVGLAHGLETVVRAARLLPDVQVLILGSGARADAIREEARGLAHVHVRPGLPSDRVPEVYAASDVLVVPLRDLPVFETVIPSKMFEIWAMEKPLVLGVRGVAADIVEQSGAGVVVPPEEPEALAGALRALVADPDRRRELGRRGRAFVEAHYDRNALATRYLELLEEVGGTHRRRRRRMSWRFHERSR